MVWFMFETSLWPLRGDRNVGGRGKAGAPWDGPALIFGKEGCMCTCCSRQPEMPFRPWQRLQRKEAGFPVPFPIT